MRPLAAYDLFYCNECQHMNAMLLIRGDLLADGTLGAGVLEGTVTSVAAESDITGWVYFGGA